jgi:FkbM family methyltransferase
MSMHSAGVFHVDRLPLLARLHQAGFRGSRRPPSSPIRLAARAGFYLLRRLSRGPVLARMRVDVEGVPHFANFDARNRQFAAVYFERYASGYEPEVAAVIDACLDERGVFYDVGSNWGYFSVLAASRPGFRGKVHAFEPWPDSFRDLCSIVEQLGLASRIACNNFALGEAPCSATMTAGSHSGLARIAAGAGKNSTTRVEVRTLDELALDPPSLIKIDTEGHEENVLRGGARLLEAHRPTVIFEHRRENDAQWQNAEVLDFLGELGYRLFIPRLDDCSRHLDVVEVDAQTRMKHAGDADLLACHATRLSELDRRIKQQNKAA